MIAPLWPCGQYHVFSQRPALRGGEAAVDCMFRVNQGCKIMQGAKELLAEPWNNPRAA